MADQILETLARFYAFDLWVFTQWWLYAPLGIPAVFYFAFFVVKWWVLTLPVWMPFYVIVKAFRSDEK